MFLDLCSNHIEALTLSEKDLPTRTLCHIPKSSFSPADRVKDKESRKRTVMQPGRSLFPICLRSYPKKLK